MRVMVLDFASHQDKESWYVHAGGRFIEHEHKHLLKARRCYFEGGVHQHDVIPEIFKVALKPHNNGLEMKDEKPSVGG